jgi:hydrogenase maturation protein HypF
MDARKIEIEGTVQGVGFRPWVHRVATSLGLRGRVFNTPRGVTIEVAGAREALDALVRALNEDAPRASRVRRIREEPLPARATEEADAATFVIAPSEGEGDRLLTVPADLATCDACFREVDDPHDRHHRYPFTSCTECGPRFSIVEALPYDRARTTLGPFTLCPDCEREYRDLGDRRFHAQAIACPACGPKIWLEDANAARLGGAAELDPIGVVAERLIHGGIVAIQGLGGFHLACDATSGEVVAELRRRKRRDDKPFAIMVADLATAEAIAILDDDARAALISTARPIVLAPRRPRDEMQGLATFAPEVVGISSRVGVFLPYTPLHKLLLARVGRPLVMTSGNLSGEPIAITHDDARRALAGIVDVFLLHDRPIVRRVEDSVVASSGRGGGTRVIRRARGFAPDPIRLPIEAPEPILAVGGHLKNTACLVLGDRAYVTPHLGDLETYESERAFRDDVETFERLLGVRAQILAHDLHPFYSSTRYARERPARMRVGVQHHVAHVQAAIAELHLEGPVLGVVFDGTGWGADLTAWGAEILRVDGSSWSRPSTFRAVPLAGGERAIREVWRIALGALREAFGPDEALALAARLPVFREVTVAARTTVVRMLGTGVQTVAARGMGRWFDAFGALALGMSEASFEGQVAIALEEAAGDLDAKAYPVTLPTTLSRDAFAAPCNEIDLRPTVRVAVSDLIDGVAGATIAARFHRTIVDATAAVVACALAETHAHAVVLSGGSFQNRLLERGLHDALGDGRARIAVPREVPVNDGGIALGQAYSAVLAAREWGLGRSDDPSQAETPSQPPATQRAVRPARASSKEP